MTKPLHKRAVPAAFATLLYEYLQERGCDPELLLGMPWPAVEPDQQNTIDISRWEEMLNRAYLHLDEPLLGLHLGNMVSARHLGVVGHLLLACENFDAVLKKLEHYQRLIFDVIPMTRRERPGAVDIVWDISEFRTTALVGETGFAVMVQFCRYVMRDEGNPLAIEFAHPPPDDIKPYEDFFQCPVRFNCPAPVISASAELLALPVRQPDMVMEHLLEQHAGRLLSHLPWQLEIVAQVRKVITTVLRDGDPDINKVAAKMFRSSRSLQRHLQLAGTSFRQEVGLVRNELAKSYLQDERLQVSEIAGLLGYSEHSAFSRAFKKQNGHAPRRGR